MFDDFQDMEENGEDIFESAFAMAEPEGLLPPKESNFFVAHEDNTQKLLDFVNSNAMPHALILSGIKGIGKSTFAFRVARCLLKNGIKDANQDSLFGDEAPAELKTLDIDKNDPVFSKVASGGHPDLLAIGRPLDTKKGVQKSAIDVDTARKVTPFLRMTASDGGWRIVIVDDADTMNRNAQNALLKILEEPPPNTLIMLVCHRLGSMIPTIRSRCRVLNFAPLDEASLATLMTREVGNSLSNEDKEVLNFLSNGSIGQAQSLIESGGIETAHKILYILESWPHLNWVDIHHLADQAARGGQNDLTFYNIEITMRTIFERLIFAKAKNQQPSQPLQNKVYSEIIGRYSLHDLTEMSDKLAEHFRQARFSNLDKKQAVLGAFNIITT